MGILHRCHPVRVCIFAHAKYLAPYDKLLSNFEISNRYVAEIFPNHLRSAGVALSLACFYLASEITLCVAPIAMDSIGWKFYLVLICPSFFFIIFLYRYIPETRGRTLEEIGATFGDENIACQWYGLTEDQRNTLYAQTISEKGNKELFAGEGDAQTVEDINASQSAR